MNIQFTIDLYYVLHLFFTSLFFISTICCFTVLLYSLPLRVFLSIKILKVSLFMAFFMDQKILILTLISTVLFYRNFPIIS